jgi:hypothetical protein
MYFFVLKKSNKKSQGKKCFGPPWPFLKAHPFLMVSLYGPFPLTPARFFAGPALPINVLLAWREVMHGRIMCAAKDID